MGQERLDRAAKQGRVMARHRRDDEQLRLTGAAGEAGADEAEQTAKRLGPDDVLEDRVCDAVDLNLVEPESRLAVAARHALEQFRPGRDVLAKEGVGERVPGIAEHEMGRVGDRPRRRQRRVGHLVELVGVAQ